MKRHRTKTALLIGFVLALLAAGASRSSSGQHATTRGPCGASETRSVAGVSAPCSRHIAAVKPTVFVAQSAAGTADGTSCANARPIAFFNTALNWGPGKPIGPGKVVGVCGTISVPLVAQGSGATGEPITIYFTPGAKISRPVCDCLDLSNRSFLTVDGGTNGIVEATDNGTNLGHQSVGTAIRAYPCNDCEIKNLTIRNIYVHDGSGDHTEVDQTQVRAIFANGSNIRVHDNTVHDAGWALFFDLDSGNHDDRIYRNDIYNVDHGVITSFGFSGGSVGPIFVNNNHFHDFANWDTDSNAYHHDGIHCYTAGTGGSAAHISNYYIYGNRFDGNIGGNATAWIFMEGGSGPDSTPCADSSSNIWVFNNFARLSHDSFNGAFGLFTGINKVFQNTLAGRASDDGTACEFNARTGMAMQNNLCMSANHLIGMSPAAFAPGSPDFNVYADGGNNAFVCSGNFYSFGQFSQWRSCIGGDSHSSHVADAKVDPDGRPRAGSPVLGAGTDLSSLCTGDLAPLCLDITGARRPLRMAPDVGAYQAETAAIAEKAVGRAQIGAPQSAVEQFYGQKRAVRSRRPLLGTFDIRGAATATYHLHRGLLEVSYLEGRVVAVTTTSLYYVTAGGFGIGAQADESALAGNGWRPCGRALVKRRAGIATAIRVAGGHVTALTLSRSADIHC